MIAIHVRVADKLYGIDGEADRHARLQTPRSAAIARILRAPESEQD